jgi:hypothetical protein
VTASSQPHLPPTPAFGGAELVFAGHPDRIPGITGPVFGRSDEWPADAIRRPSNKPPGAWKLRFPAEAAWNLRARETCFALLNPAHRALREAGVHLPARPAALGTLVQVCHHLTMLMRWAGQHQLPADLPSWTTAHWDAFLAETAGRVGPSSVTGYVSSIRRLAVLGSVLTGGGPAEDPWPGRTAADVGRRVSRAVSTVAIPPATWWPLLRAAWTYIDVFADDLLDLRDRAAAAAAAQAGRLPGSQVSASYDRLVAGWLADPANLVPVHATAWRDVPAGAPRWTALSLAITGGATDSIFAAGHQRGTARRALIEAAAASGRAQPLSNGQAVPGAPAAQDPPPSRARSAVIDAGLRRWLADPASRIPVRGRDHRNGVSGTVLWATLARLIHPGHRSSHIFAGTAGQRRRDLVTAAAAAGRVHISDGEADPALGRLDCSGFAVVTRGDDTTGPWLERLGPDQLDHELRMLRAAIYIFTAALSMMRDSEIQEIQRGAVTTHYGSPAVTSHKTKLDPARPQLRWWITEPVAQAIAVAERLSTHPTHIFATLNPPPAARDGVIRNGRRGISARNDIDLFIAHINATGHRLGLAPIPAGRVRPHMFRRTMSIITGQEPDSEIALGLQLKHAARRALANAATPGYAGADTAWAREFGNQLELAAARRLADLLHARRDGHAVAVGPGAARLHAGLDKVNAALGSTPALRAQPADQRTEITLLRDEFADLHFGTINHCLWDPAQAECQNTLPPAQRGQAPLIGACHPARCRNSAITATHAPAWLAEEADLTAMLRQTRLAPPRKQALQQRLADVQRITSAWHQQGH